MIDVEGIMGVGKAIRLFRVFPFFLFPCPSTALIEVLLKERNGGKTLALVRLTDPLGLILLDQRRSRSPTTWRKDYSSIQSSQDYLPTYLPT